MSNKKIIQEAKADFEAIKKYASEEAKKQLDKKIEEKLNALQESISVEADGATINIDDSTIEVNKGDSTVTVNKETGMETPLETQIPAMDATDFEVADSDEKNEEQPEEIEELFEIRSLNEEEEAKDAVLNPFQPVIDKLDIIINKLGATEGGTDEENGEVAIIDDENPTGDATNPDLQPDAMPEPAAPAPQAQPTINEFNLEEYENMDVNNEEAMVQEIMNALAESGYEIEEDEDETLDSDDDNDDDTLNFDSEDDSDEDELDMDNMTDDSDDTQEIKITINGDDCDCVIVDADDEDSDDTLDFDVEDDDLEISDDEEPKEDELDETRGIGLGVKHLSANRNRDSKNIEESKNIKAHYESKLDELIQENNSLKSDIKEFEDSFVELRNSIDEMQTFNAKLAYANKLFLNGGLSVSDKISINESLDKARTVKEAHKIYEKLKEGKTIVSESKKNSLRNNTTKTATGSQPLYESNEAKTLKNEVSRTQILAGIKKREE